MDGLSGHLFRESAQQLWPHHHSNSRHSGGSSVEAASSQRYGFSSSYEEPQQQQHEHYHHQHHPNQQQQLMQQQQSGGGPLRHHHLQQQQERYEIHSMNQQSSSQQSSSTGSNSGDLDNPSRQGMMSVQDLKQMTAIRMAQQKEGGGGGGDNRAGGSNGGGGGQMLSSSRSPTGSDQLSSSSRHRLGLVHGNSSPELMGGGGLARPSSAPHHHQHQMLRAAREHQHQQQHDMPSSQQQLLLARHSSVGSPSLYSRQQQQRSGGRGQQQLASSRLVEGVSSLSAAQHHHHQAQQQQQQQQQQMERGIRRGISAPRMYPSADDSIAHGQGGGGSRGVGGGDGGGGGQRPVFGPGLSVEKLKELTKLRLQQQQQQEKQAQQHQGQGRNSPSFSARQLSSSALGSSLGSNNGGSGGVGSLGHHNERTEWRRSGSAGSAAMMEEHHRSLVEESTGSFRRRANSLMAPRVGTIHAEQVGVLMHGSRRPYGSSSGRMEGPFVLEDRMRTLQSEAARGGGGGVSPRILSQPSSPCFSATSHSSSACASPGRVGRAGGGRHDNGGGPGFFHARDEGGGGPPGFPVDGGMRMDGDGALHTTLSFRLSGDGGRAIGERDAGGFWGSSGSGLATAPPGGNIAMGFPSSGSSSGSLHDSAGGRNSRGMIGGGSRSNGASPAMHAMSAPKSYYGASRLVGGGSSGAAGGYLDDHSDSGRSSNGAAGLMHGASLLRPGSAGPPSGRGASSLMPPPDLEVVTSRSFHGVSSGSMTDGIRASAVRKNSYDERRTAASWLDGPQNPPGGRGDASRSGSDTGTRPADLRIAHASHVDIPYGAGRDDGGGARRDGVRDLSTWGAAARGNNNEDVTAMMCAEFALLTPKRALEQQQQQQQQRQSSAPSSSLDMWPSTGWASQTGGDSSSGHVGVPRAGSANSSSAGSFGHATGSQGSRGGSEIGSPEGPHASGVGGAAGGGVAGDNVDENSASSGGSGGGGRQGSVRPAFGTAPDAAAGPGGGGGGEASVDGGAFDASFPLRADGDSRFANGGNGFSNYGNGGMEAQHYGLPLVKSTAFFGADLGGEALEDAGTAESLSSSMSDNLGTIHHHHHLRHNRGNGAFSTGASPSRGGGRDGDVGESSPGPLDGSSLAAALQNQLSFS